MTDTTINNGKRITGLPFEFDISLNTWKKAMIKKYIFAILENCSNNILGIKLK